MCYVSVGAAIVSSKKCSQAWQDTVRGTLETSRAVSQEAGHQRWLWRPAAALTQTAEYL